MLSGRELRNVVTAAVDEWLGENEGPFIVDDAEGLKEAIIECLDELTGEEEDEGEEEEEDEE